MTLIGNLAVDVHVYADASRGDEDGPADIRIAVGGSIVNHARAHRALGVPVQLLSLYADDSEGQVIGDGLRDERLPHDGLFALLVRNHRTVLLIAPGGEKHMWSDRATLPDFELIRAAISPRLDGTRHVHVSPNAWTTPLVEDLLSDDVAISADLHVLERVPAPSFLSRLRVLFFSAVGQDDIDGCMSELLARGPELVLCTAAGDGCYVGRRGSMEILHHPAVSPGADVVDTIGAGDVFAATFLAHWYGGLGLDESVLRAQIQASHSVTARGLDHLLDADELARRAALPRGSHDQGV